MRHRKWIFFVAPPAVVLFCTLFGFIIKWLWNWLLPAIFAGAHLITFWQAIGLLLLCRILFGSWAGGHNGGWQRRRKEKWEAMSPEEREKFRQSMRARCGFGPSASEPARPSANPA
jgi:hypothetical protein